MATDLGLHADAFDHQQYVPCLRWKQGEYQAVLRLTPRTKGRITPLIEVPEIGWDFEEQKEAKSLEEHIEPFAKRVEQKWGRGLCFVDLHLLPPNARMPDGRHPADHVFAELRKRRCTAVPVTGCDRDAGYRTAVRRIVQRDHAGVCLRLGIRQATRGDAQKVVDGLLRRLGVSPPNVDLILDLDAPANFEPVDGFVKLLLAVVRRLPHRDDWRTFTLMGTSFPETMGALRRGPQLIDRYEWVAYRMLTDILSRSSQRLPTFGDYGIANPEVLHIDMRLARPAASIRYTTDDAWYILKGRNVRDHGYGQYRSLCRTVVSSPHFAGRRRSTGDAYIDDCAKSAAKTGNLTTWRWVGTNHHIEKVVTDIANRFAP